MAVWTSGNTTVLKCDHCTNRTEIKKKELSSAEWEDSKGWKELRRRAYASGWRISASETGDHYCSTCIAKYDF